VITVLVCRDPIAAVDLYSRFLRAETDTSGTVVLHHGRVKRPGKQIRDFSSVLLEPVADDPQGALAALCAEAHRRFGLNRVLLTHRVGRLGAGDTVLVAIVSAATRVPAFDGCRFLVEEVKRERAIRLVEMA